MILVDTSVWIDHFRSGSATLSELLEGNAVVGHPWVTGELALGSLSHRDEVIGLLHALPQAIVADDHEVLRLIDLERLHERGIGYVDVQLVAATRLTRDTTLWTTDKRLAAVAAHLGISFQPTPHPGT